MNDKRIIENYKSVRTVERSQRQPLTPEDVAYIQNLIKDGCIKAQANPKPETRSLSEISGIENDKSKSQARKDFEIHIAKVADRIKNHIEPNKEPLPLESETKSASDEPLPLHERIKFLRLN